MQALYRTLPRRLHRDAPVMSVQRGLVLPGARQHAAEVPLETASVPPQLILSLEQPDGRVLIPCVAAGDPLKMGQVVARPSHDRGVPLHSPVSGHVAGIEERDAIGMDHRVPVLILNNDGRDSRDTTVEAIGDYARCTPDFLRARLEAGGIVGLGGAAFPTHLKLSPYARAPIEALLLNGVECEPGISCDDALMRYRAGDVVLGAQVLLHILQAPRCMIAIEADKPEAIAAMEAAVLAAIDKRISVVTLPTYYPAGGERQLIAALCGKEVPTGGLPRDIGIVCQNVGTAAAIAILVTTGEPLLRRIVTITGHGVAQPRNLEVRLGTPITDLIRACGGYATAVHRLIAGGLMMGTALPHDDFTVGKATNCIIAATASDLQPRGAEMPCIRCGDCASVCPAGLLPQELYRHASLGDQHDVKRLGLADCIECGSCDYVCPSQLPLTATFKVARIRITAEAADTEQRSLARHRFAAHSQRLADAKAEQQRKLREKRLARGE